MIKELIKPMLYFFLFAILLNSCSIGKIVSKRTQTKLINSTLNHEQINEDINHFLTNVEAIAPNPYIFGHKTKIDSIANKIKSYQTLEPIEFYEKLQVLIGSFNIPHLYSYFPVEYLKNNIKKDGGFFPVKCKMVNDSLKTRYSVDTSVIINKGDVILQINNLDADSLFHDFYKYTGGLEKRKERLTSSYFSHFLWMNKIYPPFTIKILDTNNNIENYTLKGFNPFASKKKKSKKKKSSSNPNSLDKKIKYKRINDTIAVIDFNSMSIYKKEKQFTGFLNNTFLDIKEKETAMLIIDLRNNGGGQSVYGKMLIDYFTSKPYRMAGGKKWKVSQEYKDNIKKAFPWHLRFIVARHFKEYFNHPNGSFIEDSTKIKQPGSNDLRYEGPVYVVINTGVFSSANMMANAIEDFDLATIVGQPSGAVVNELGEILAVRLPNSGISCWIPSAMFIRANGDSSNQNPVLPCIWIEQEKLNTIKMEELVKIIENSKN